MPVLRQRLDYRDEHQNPKENDQPSKGLFEGSIPFFLAGFSSPRFFFFLQSVLGLSPRFFFFVTPFSFFWR
jgi:hypothetical protein